MHKLKYTLLSLFFFCQFVKAQLPGNDSAWVLQTSLSDEFNASYIDSTTKWVKHYGNIISTNPIVSLANGAELNFSSNLIMTGNTLKIRADTLIPNITVTDTTKLVYNYSEPNGDGIRGPLTFAYQGGVIMSQSTAYKYGYLEIYAKYPSKKFSLWPAFWIQGSDCGTSHYVNEIDIAEGIALNSYAGNLIGNNLYVTDHYCSYDSLEYLNIQNPILPVDSLSGGFHKFALKWDPHNLTYLFDDITTTVVDDASGHSVPQNGLHVFLNFCIEPGRALLPSNWIGVTPPSFGPKQTPTKWPQNFEIDYFRYYKLVTECNNTQSICIPSDYNRKVKQMITAGGGACMPTYNASNWNSSYTLRATDYVLLDVGVTITPTGTGYFAIETLACPQ
jgi:hypothetical protein